MRNDRHLHLMRLRMNINIIQADINSYAIFPGIDYKHFRQVAFYQITSCSV